MVCCPVSLDRVRSHFAGVFGKRLPQPFAVFAFRVVIAHNCSAATFLVFDKMHAQSVWVFDSNRADMIAIIHHLLTRREDELGSGHTLPTLSLPRRFRTGLQRF